MYNIWNEVFDLDTLENKGILNIDAICINEHCAIKMAERNISLISSDDILDMFIIKQTWSHWKTFYSESFKWIIRANGWYLVCKVFQSIKNNKKFVKILSVLSHDQLVSSKNLLCWSHWKYYFSINTKNSFKIDEKSINHLGIIDSKVLASATWIILKTWIMNDTSDFYFSDSEYTDLLSVFSRKFWFSEVRKYIATNESDILSLKTSSTRPNIFKIESGGMPFPYWIWLTKTSKWSIVVFS